MEGVDQDWREAERALWIVDGEGAGQHQQLGNLSFLIVKGAGECSCRLCYVHVPCVTSYQRLVCDNLLLVKGHLMPMDKPKEALDMVHRFLSGKSFADRDLPAAGGDDALWISCATRLHVACYTLKRTYNCVAVEYSGASLPGESVALTSSVPEEGHGSRVLMLLVIVALGEPLAEHVMIFTRADVVSVLSFLVALWIANSRPSQQRKKHHTSGSEEGEVIQAGGSSWLTNPSYQQAELGYQRLEVQGSDTR